jgi:two-component system NtrC family sensor kinase
VRLSGADMGAITLREGDTLRFMAGAGQAAELHAYERTHPHPLGRGTFQGRAALEGSTIHVPDVFEDAEYERPEAAILGSFRAVLSVPLKRGQEAIGVFGMARRTAGPFAQRQIELVETFADQAVIAIENARLFEEVRARTAELTESLQQQTATADVLKVISRSTYDLQKVLDALTITATRSCEADKGAIMRGDGELYRFTANAGFSKDLVEYATAHPLRAVHGSATARAVLESRTIHLPDVLDDPGYTLSEYQRLGEYRTLLAVPLLREGAAMGVFLLARNEVRPFSQKQIELVETFADQAVIAIQNVKLFDEVQARTAEVTEALKQQTATADVLKVISRSAFDLQPVLDTLTESAAQLCEADMSGICRSDGSDFYYASSFGFSPGWLDFTRGRQLNIGRGSVVGRVLLGGSFVQIDDVLADPDFTFLELQEKARYRTLLGVPLMRENKPIGVLLLGRSKVAPFNAKQIELVETFADQAVIAIENVRLFESVEARTRELTRSLSELRTAQDRLIQTEKLASLGQLTAGVAHEIKNPLNFVNNFSSLSSELIEELGDVLDRSKLETGIRAEIQELMEVLRGNLTKVVEHSKRADTIVKNMLLHSREGSGEHLPTNINSLVEGSLNLAYHGARAERRDFKITLEKALDPEAGEVDLYPQEITRVLLNLISNGFYATGMRCRNTKGPYEPILSAATKDLGEHVEIRIRDNGTGISPDVRERMFNPFFTTKPAGEGTGLGLSLSHDIVVKQHAGTIEVETEPGAFTEFRIVLPRGAATLAKPGDKA